MFGDSIGELRVEGRNGTSMEYVTLFSRVGQQHSSSASSWTFQEILLAHDTDMVRWVGVYNGSWQGDIAIDTIRVLDGSIVISQTPTDAPTMPPTSLTETEDGTIFSCDFNPATSHSAVSVSPFCGMNVTGDWTIDTGGYTSAANTGPSFGASGTGSDHFAYIAGHSVTTWLSRKQWAINSTYRIAPFNVTSGGYIDGNTVADYRIRYELVWQNETNPRGFFIDSTTGEMLLQVPNIPGVYYAAVEARYTGTSPLTMYNVSFDLKSSDTNVPSNGPNGRDCQGGKIQQVDAIEFDLQYTCNCPPNTVGANCDTATDADNYHSADENTTLVFIITGTFFAVILLVLLLGWIMIKHSRNRPVNMSEVQSQILESLGIGGAALDVASDEVCKIDIT